MHPLHKLRARTQSAPHGRKWIERTRARDMLHECLARHLATAPDPLDEAACVAVEGR